MIFNFRVFLYSVSMWITIIIIIDDILMTIVTVIFTIQICLWWAIDIALLFFNRTSIHIIHILMLFMQNKHTHLDAGQRYLF